MKTAQSSFVLLVAALVVACYGSRDTDPDRVDGGSDDEPPHQPEAGRDPGHSGSGGFGGGGVGGGAELCRAFRTEANDRIGIDQAAFSGIGGAGAALAGTCKRCGWDSSGRMCQTLVASVPKIANPNYYPCFDLSLQFALCLDRESCVCSGEVPAACDAIKADQDACLMNGVDADGGADLPAEWKDVQTRCHFGFTAPADYHDTPVQGTDSCVLAFSAGGCDFSADYGAFSGQVTPSDGDLEFRGITTEIDGREATVVSFSRAEPTRYMAAVYFSQVQADTLGPKLTLIATCKSARGQTDAQTLFNTIHFGD